MKNIILWFNGKAIHLALYQPGFKLMDLKRIYNPREETLKMYSLTICDLLDCSPPGSSVHGILQARILDWVDTVGRLFTTVVMVKLCPVVSNSLQPHGQLVAKSQTRLSNSWYISVSWFPWPVCSHSSCLRLHLYHSYLGLQQCAQLLSHINSCFTVYLS